MLNPVRPNIIISIIQFIVIFNRITVKKNRTFSQTVFERRLNARPTACDFRMVPKQTIFVSDLLLHGVYDKIIVRTRGLSVILTLTKYHQYACTVFEKYISIVF